MNKKARDEEELIKASHLLHYEFELFSRTAEPLKKELKDSKQIAKTISNAIIIESFLLHMRVLIDFFYPSNPKCDDILVTDFFQNREDWKSTSDMTSKFLDGMRERAHKNLVHLTYNRKEDSDPWPILEIYNNIIEELKNFVTVVQKKKLHSCWNNFNT